MARLQAVRGHEVTNVFHDNIGLPKLALRILALLDGSRDQAALRFKQFKIGAKETAILVGVRIAQHDLLRVVPRLE